MDFKSTSIPIADTLGNFQMQTVPLYSLKLAREDQVNWTMNSVQSGLNIHLYSALPSI